LRGTIRSVPSKDLLEEALLETTRLVVADPAVDGGSCGQALARLRHLSPGTLIVLYTRLRAAVLPAVVQLAGLGVREVIIAGTDDPEFRFREIEECTNAAALTGCLMAKLEDRLRELPPAVAAAIREMFDVPRRIPTVDHLAAAAGLHRRSLYRHLATAGFSSPRLLVASARALRAAHMLAESTMSVRHVAKTLGFSKPDMLAFQLDAVIGLRPTELRDRQVLAMVPALVAERLRCAR
jgi:AraC-like DNA-binding protein